MASRDLASRVLLRVLSWFVPRRWRDSIHGDLEEELAAGRAGAAPRARDLIGIAARFAFQELGVTTVSTVASGLGKSVARVAATGRRDVGFGLRLIRRQPGTTLVAVGSLAVALGGSTVGFAVVDGVLLRPVRGVEEPARLVSVFGGSPDRPLGAISFPDFRDYATRAAPFENLTAFVKAEATRGEPPAVETTSVEVVTADYFATAGVRLMLGRPFTEREGEAGAPPVGVVSYRFWQRELAESATAIGESVRLNGRRFQVVGVAPRSFRGLTIEHTPEVWVTTAHIALMKPEWPSTVLTERHWSVWSVVGRLAEGASRETATAALAVVSADLDRQDSTGAPRVVTVAGIQEAASGPANRDALATYSFVLVGVLGLLLAVACLNIATLLLARGASRQRELGVRMALGASRAALVRQLALEGLMLAAAAAGAGLVVAGWLMPVMSAVEMPVPLALDLSLNSRLVSFAVLMSLAAGLTFSVWPAIGLSRPGLVRSHDAVGVQHVANQLRPRRALLVAQVALSVVLLVSAGLLVRTFFALQAVHPGFAPATVAAARIDPERSGLSADAATARFLELADRVRSESGVRAATLSSYLPLHPHSSSLEVFANDVTAHVVKFNLVGRDYFSVLGVPLIEGRLFTSSEWTDRPALVVSEAMANQLWPDESAVGQFLTTRRGGPHWDVVGVAGDVKYEGLREADTPLMYIPFPYVPKMFSSGMYLTVSASSGAAAAPALPLRQALVESSTTTPVLEEVVLSEAIARAVAPERQSALVLTAVALIAFALAIFGVFGLSAFNLAKRHREFGVRIALGATSAGVVTLVLRESLTLVLMGLTLGGLASVATGRLLASRLFGVPTLDPWTLVVVGTAVMLTALVVTFSPARRAAQLEVVRALRSD